MNKFISALLLLCVFLGFSVATFAQEDPALQAGMDEKNTLKKIEFFTRSIENKPSGDAHFERGWAYLDLGRYHSAIKDFKTALHLPGNKTKADINNALAVVYLGLGQYQNSIDYSTKAIDEIEYYASAYRTRHLALLRLSKNEDAEKDINRYLRFLPEYADGWHLRHDFYFKQKKYDLALKDIDSAIKRDISERVFKLKKIYTLHLMGREADADRLIRQTIDINDNDPLSLQAVGNIYFEMRYFERAALFHNKALTLHDEKSKNNPKYRENNLRLLYDLNLLLAQDYRSAGDYTKALKYYTQAVNLMPGNYLAYERLGNLHGIDLKNYEQAVGAFAKSFELNPKNPDGWVSYGVALSRLGKTAGSVSIYERALKLDSVSGTSTIHNNLADSYLKLKKYPQCFTHVQKAIELDPDQPTFYITRGEYYLAINKYQEALKDFDFASEMENAEDDQKASAFRFKGLTYLKVKKTAEAVSQLKAAVLLAPTDSDILGECGTALYENGSLCEARGYFRKALAANPSTELSAGYKEYLLKIASKTKNDCRE